MKKAVASILLAVMVAGMAGNAYAAPSISQFIPEAPTLISGNIQEGERLVVQNADISAYKDKKVAETVKWVNDDNTVSTVKEVLTKVDVDTTKEIRTESGKKVNPTLYEQLTPFADLVIKSGKEVKYESSGTIKASMTFETAKEMKKQELLLMQIDPNTRKVYFVTPETFDRKEGTIIADFPTLGPIALLRKIPIVVKNVSPEKYENKITADTVKKFLKEKADIKLDDVLTAMGIHKNEETGVNINIKINAEVTVKRDDYSSVMGFADIAMKQGSESYFYDMDGQLQVEASRDLNEIDWERLVLSEYPYFVVEKAKKDLTVLEDLDPFVLKDSFIMQLNTITGEEEYIYEPVIYFGHAEAETDDDEDSLLNDWKIEDEDCTDKEIPNLVICAEFRSMGPFAIFMKSYIE